MNLNFWKKDNVDSVEEETVVYQPESQFPGYLASTPETENYDSSMETIEEVEPADPAKAAFYNKISRWAVYMGVFLLPLFFLPGTTSILELNKLMLLLVVSGVGIVSWLLGIVSSGYLAWRSNLMDKGLVALLGGFVVASIFSMSPFSSLFGLSPNFSSTLTALVCLTMLYFLVVNNTDDRGKTLKGIIGLSMILALLYGVLQMFGWHVLRFSFAVTKSFNTVGAINSLGIISAVLLPFFSKTKLDVFGFKNLHLEKIGVVLSLLLLIVINWWVLWSVAIAGMVAMIVFENLGGVRFKMNKLLLPMTVVILGVFMMVVQLDLSALKKDLPVEVSPSFTLSRDILIPALKEKPIFGYGLEQFSIAFDKYGAGKLANSTLSDVRFSDSMSEIMTLLVQGGSVMAAALLFFFYCVGFVLWRFKRYVAENKDSGVVKEDIGTLASTIAILVAMFLYPFNMTLIGLLFVLLALSVLAIFNNYKKEFNIEERPALSLTSSLGFIGGLILVLVGVYFGATMYMGDAKYAQAINSDNNEEITGLLVEAINWNNKDARYYRSASQAALSLLNEEISKPQSAERDARIQNYVSTSISLAQRATEIASADASNWANLGFVYRNLLALVDGVDKLAENAYTKASELRPGDPAFSYQVGMLYIGKLDLLAQLVASRRATSAQVNPQAQEAIAKAEESLKKAVELAPNFGLAIYNLGIVYDRQGKVNEAISQIEKLAAANSNQAGLAFELALLYYRAERKTDAFNELQRAVSIAPDYANALWYLALINEERGNIDAAVANLERIISNDVNKDNPVVLEKLEQLRSGERQIPPQEVLDQEPLQ